MRSVGLNTMRETCVAFCWKKTGSSGMFFADAEEHDAFSNTVHYHALVGPSNKHAGWTVMVARDGEVIHQGIADGQERAFEQARDAATLAVRLYWDFGFPKVKAGPEPGEEEEDDVEPD